MSEQEYIPKESVDKAKVPEVSFEDKIKDVSKENPFVPKVDAESMHIFSSSRGMHIFIGNKSETEVNISINTPDGNTIDVNNIKPVSPEKDDVEEKATGIFAQAKETIGKIKEAYKAVDEFSKTAHTAYKKTKKILSKGMIAIAFASVLPQAIDVASMAHSNNYSWQDTRAELVDHYAPLYKEFDIHKDVYAVCEQDRKLCITTGALVGVAASKSVVLLGTGTMLMMASDKAEERTTLGGFLGALENATGYALTRETSELNRLEREQEALLKEQTPLVRDREISSTNLKVEGDSTYHVENNESNLSPASDTPVFNRVRDTQEISSSHDQDREIKKRRQAGSSMSL